MKKILVIFVLLSLCLNIFATGVKEQVPVENWPSVPITVVCPWAKGGLVDIINHTTASYGEEVFGQPIVATNDYLKDGAISLSDDFLSSVYTMLGDGGNVALANYVQSGINPHKFIIGSENAFAIAPVLRASYDLPFTFDDFEPIIGFYSSIFVLIGAADLGITNLEELKTFGREQKISIAVGGTASLESFLAQALFKELGLEYEIIHFNGANVALESLMKNEVHFAVSHQFQAKAGVESGYITPIVLFDKEGTSQGVFAGTKGIGEYGYTFYCLNRSFLMARKGTDPVIINKIYEGYKEILSKDEIKTAFEKAMITLDPLDGAGINEHIEEVKKLVKAHL